MKAPGVRILILIPLLWVFTHAALAGMPSIDFLQKEERMKEDDQSPRDRRPSDRRRRAQEKLARLMIRIERLHCGGDRLIHKDLRSLRLQPTNKLALRELERRLSQLELESAVNPDPLRYPPPPGLFDWGELLLGRIVAGGEEYRIPLQSLPCSVCIVAPIGKGKSTTAARLIYELSQAGTHRLAVIARKADLAGLAYLPERPIQLVVYSRDLRIALWQPPEGVSKIVFAEAVCSLLAACFGMELSQQDLLQTAKALLVRFEKLNGPPRWPSLQDTIHALRSLKPKHVKHRQYIATAVTVLGLLQEYSRPLFDASRGNLDGILGQRVLIVTEDLPDPRIYRFCSDYIYQYCYLKSTAEGRGDGTLQQALFFEDAQHMVAQERPPGSHSTVSPFTSLVLRSRSAGVASIPIFQGGTNADLILGQAGVLICPGATTTTKETLCLANALGLHGKDAWILQQGQLGDAVVRNTMSQYPLPVRIHVEPVRFDRNILPAKIRNDFAQALSAIPWAPLVQPEEDASPPTTKPTDSLSPAAFQLLVEVAAHPEKPITFYCDRIGLSGFGRKKAELELLARGLIRAWNLAGYKFIEIRLDGYSKLGIEPPGPRGRGGFLHRLVVHRVEAAVTRAGGQPLGTEFCLPNGKVTDWAFRQTGSLVAVEVASGESNEALNIRSCLQPGGADLVWSVAFRQSISRRIRRRLSQQRDRHLLPRISFRLASEFLKQEDRDPC